MKQKILILLIFLFAIFTTAKSQTDTIRLGVDSTRAVGQHIPIVSISHVNPQQVTFKISLDKTNWNSFSTKGNETKLIDIGKYDKCFFSIATDDKKISKYIVYKGKSYRIYWNDNDKKWDLSEDKKE